MEGIGLMFFAVSLSRLLPLSILFFGRNRATIRRRLAYNSGHSGGSITTTVNKWATHVISSVKNEKGREGGAVI